MTSNSRNAVAALAGVLAIVLLIVLLTQGPPAPETPPDADRISGEIEIPEFKQQRKIRYTELEPTVLGTGFSQETIDEVWQLTEDFLRDWTLNPELMIEHRTDADELAGAAKQMTAETGKRWRRTAYRALAPYEDGFRSLQMRPKAVEQVLQLIHWNMLLGDERGWQNPMFAKGTLDGLVLMGPPRLGIMVRFTSQMRMQGKGDQYRTPFVTTLFLIWVQVDGEWRISEYSRGAVTGKERRVGDDDAESPSPGTSEEPAYTPPPLIEEGDPTTIWPS